MASQMLTMMTQVAEAAPDLGTRQCIRKLVLGFTLSSMASHLLTMMTQARPSAEMRSASLSIQGLELSQRRQSFSISIAGVVPPRVSSTSFLWPLHTMSPPSLSSVVQPFVLLQDPAHCIDDNAHILNPDRDFYPWPT